MRAALAISDVVGSFAIIWLMLRITHGSDIRTSHGRWGLFCRFAYGIVALMLFIKGIYRIETDETVAAQDGLPQLVILWAIVGYAAVKAMGLVGPDTWGDFRNGRQR